MSHPFSFQPTLKTFIIKCTLFVICIFILLAISEICVRNRISSYSIKSEYIKKHGADISTLILGSSHTYYGLNPKWIKDSCFNLANISQTPEYDLDLLKRNLPYLPNLRRVIIPISYFTFTDRKLEDSDEWFLCINYKIYMDVGEHSDWSKYNFTFSHSPSFTARMKNLFNIDSKQNICDSLGFGLGYTIDKRNPKWESFAQKRAMELTRADSPRRLEVRNCLDSILNLCKDHDIKVTLLITPVWKTFREYADSSQLALMRNEAKRLQNLHNTELLDLYESSLFEADDFYDTDHLSVNGAEKLSKIVRDSIRL